MSNYLTYPCKVMNITQGYIGNYSHEPHTKGSPKDYPWDEACGDTGRSQMFCPCDEMIIKRIYTKGTNTIWLESTTVVDFADGTMGYVTLMVTHPNDSDIKRLKEGQKFKRGEPICYEGTDGNATGNHFHFAVGKGKVKGNGWVQNSKGKWVLTTVNGSQKPETMFYVDPKFTTIKNARSLVFKKLPETKKSLDEIAKEVKDGKWGNGEDRKKKLAAAGYSTSEINTIQSKVNELIYGKTTAPTVQKTFKKGDKVVLNKAKLYAGAKTNISLRSISGTYYIYDGVNFNGRYRITNSKARCGKTPIGLYVTGFVKLK